MCISPVPRMPMQVYQLLVSTHMSTFANNALLGSEVRVWIRARSKEDTTKPLIANLDISRFQ